LTDAHVDDAHALVVDLEWRGEAGAVGPVRAAVFSLVGSFAEGATYLRQRRSGAGLVFEVGTGELARDAMFAPHGHLVLLNVRGVHPDAGSEN
jgi:hypothetical protein